MGQTQESPKLGQTVHSGTATLVGGNIALKLVWRGECRSPAYDAPSDQPTEAAAMMANFRWGDDGSFFPSEVSDPPSDALEVTCPDGVIRPYVLAGVGAWQDRAPVRVVYEPMTDDPRWRRDS